MMVDALGGGGIEGLFLRNIFAGICSSDDPAGLLAKIRIDREIADAKNKAENISLAETDINALQQILALSRSSTAGEESQAN